MVIRLSGDPIRAVIRVIKKSDDRSAKVRFVYHKYDYRPKSYYQLIIKVTISEKRRTAKLWKNGKLLTKKA